MRPGQAARFDVLPVGTVFSCPDPANSPKRVKLNANTAGDYPPGPMGPGQPSYHFEGWEYCLIRERRTGPEDRRVRNDYNGHAARGPNACRTNSGRRTGDSMRFILRKQAQDRPKPSINDYKIGPAKLVFAGASALSADANDVTIYYEKGKEPRIVVDVGVIEFGPVDARVDGTLQANETKAALRALAEIDGILDSHYGPFRSFGVERMPSLVRQIIEKRTALGHELSLQQGRMAAVRSVLRLPIGDPVEAIRGLHRAIEAHEANFERQRELSMETTREKNALEAEGTRLRDRINDLEVELQQTKDRMLRERQRYKMAMMGRPTGLGPQAFAQACAWKWKFDNSSCFGTGKRLGRTTRMLDAAIEAMFGDHKRGQKILVCGACGDVDRLVSECERRMRERGYFGLTVRKRMIENAIGGVIRFAVLPPPVQVDRVERDLDRGDIFVDHFAVERLFAVLSEIDGRGPAMLRLAYPNLAAQLDR